MHVLLTNVDLPLSLHVEDDTEWASSVCCVFPDTHPRQDGPGAPEADTMATQCLDLSDYLTVSMNIFISDDTTLEGRTGESKWLPPDQSRRSCCRRNAARSLKVKQ